MLACTMDRFAEIFRSLHREKLQAAEKKAVEMFVNGDMPAVRGKRKLKPMTEVHCCLWGGRKMHARSFAVKAGRHYCCTLCILGVV